MGGVFFLVVGVLLQDVVDVIVSFYGISDEKLCDVFIIKCLVQCYFGVLDDLVGFLFSKDVEKLEEKFKAGNVDYEMNIYDEVVYVFINFFGFNYYKDFCYLVL